MRTYDCTLPITVKGRIWLALRDAWRRRKQPAAMPLEAPR
jgi:hypothetical protein